MNRVTILICLFLAGAFQPAPEIPETPKNLATFRSPVEVSYAPDGGMLASADFTGGVVYLVRAETRKVVGEIQGLDRPFGLVWLDQNRIAVSEYGSHRVSLIDVKRRSVVDRIPCTKYPMGITRLGRHTLLVSGFGKNEVGKIDLRTGREVSRIPVWYQPDFVTVSDRLERAWVSNLTPRSSARGAVISVLDLASDVKIKDIELPFGSSNVRQIIVAPDDQWVYVVHTYGKVMLPTSQLERGWVNTNVVSIIDARTNERVVTLPFDYTYKGAADPWGLTLSKDGTRLYASLAGVNELAVLQLGALHDYLSGRSRPEDLRVSDANARLASDVWAQVGQQPADKAFLAEQLAALYPAGLLKRFPLAGRGTRGIALSPDESVVVLTSYYTGELIWFDLNDQKVTTILDLGEEPEITPARKGEMIFHDGTSTYQGWLSCVSCHPAGRADGLNWDLLNDGIGNPKNAKSLLLSHATPPSMSTGIRANYEVAVRAGFHFIKFNQADEEHYAAVRAYLREMKPDPSPYLKDGKLSENARRGKELFHSEQVGCYKCHRGAYLTDMEMHNVGTRGQYDRRDEFDTPTLIEVWRTAPYLHDGSVSDLTELFSGQNRSKHWHGRTRHLSEEEVGHLIEYVKSL